MDIKDLLDDIKQIDIEPGIFKVFLMAASHLQGYDAWVSFRTGSNHDWMSECRTHGDTPDEALYKLNLILHGIRSLTCPHCGNEVKRIEA